MGQEQAALGGLGDASARGGEYAEAELKRRGHGRAAVPPGGYDAESIAAQAVSDLLAGKGRLGPGWIRPRLVRELERLNRS